MSSSESLASAMTGRVECLAVLPAAPDDPDPGAGEDTDRVGMAASSFDGTSADVGRPGVGHSTAVGEINDRGSELLSAPSGTRSARACQTAGSMAMPQPAKP